MSMDVDIHHLAAAYALDALDERERAAFEAHFPACEICGHDTADFRATLAALADLATTGPRPELKARVLQQISETRQLSPLLPDKVIELASRRRTIGRSMFTAAAAVLLVVGAIAFLAGRSSRTTDDFAAGVERVLTQPDARMVDLGLTADGSVGSLRVTWSASAHEAVIVGEDLPAPGEGEAYELWLIGDSGPVPMRVLDEAVGGVMKRAFSFSGTPKQWGVTVEPRDGSPVPTGKILLIGDA